MAEGACRRETYAARQQASTGTKSGGRQAALGRIAQLGVPDFAHGVALHLDDITVGFDGFRALSQPSPALNVGELRWIIGPNDAGKTSMMDCITGKSRPDSGQAFFGSTIDLLRLTAPENPQIGIGRKCQKPAVCEALGVFENLALADDRRVPASLFSRLTAPSSISSVKY